MLVGIGMTMILEGNPDENSNSIFILEVSLGLSISICQFMTQIVLGGKIILTQETNIRLIQHVFLSLIDLCTFVIALEKIGSSD